MGFNTISLVAITMISIKTIASVYAIGVNTVFPKLEFFMII